MVNPDIQIANYADDTTPYTVSDDVNTLLDILQKNTEILMQWFNENYMKSNNDKCHLLITSSDDVSVKIGQETLINEKQVQLLGITIDHKHNFSDHVSKLCFS